jgi:hypothetical protein
MGDMRKGDRFKPLDFGRSYRRVGLMSDRLALAANIGVAPVRVLCYV